MVVEDNKKMESLLNGQKVQVSETACTFRRRLLAEHLGMKEEEVIDPITEEFTEKMNKMVQVQKFFLIKILTINRQIRKHIEKCLLVIQMIR